MTARPTQPVRHALPAAAAGLTSDYEVVHHSSASRTGRGDGGILRKGTPLYIASKFSTSALCCIGQVLGILDRLSGTVSLSFFLQNVWLIMLTSPPSRGTALNYLARRLPRVMPEEGPPHLPPV